MRSFIQDTELPEDPRRLLSLLQRQELVLSYAESKLSNDGKFAPNVNNLAEMAITMDPDMKAEDLQALKDLQAKLIFGNPNDIDPYDIAEFMQRVNRSVNRRKPPTPPQTSVQPTTQSNGAPNGQPNRPQIVTPNNRTKDGRRNRGPLPQTQNKTDDPRKWQPNGVGYQKNSGSTGGAQNKRAKVINGN